MSSLKSEIVYVQIKKETQTILLKNQYTPVY